MTDISVAIPDIQVRCPMDYSLDNLPRSHSLNIGMYTINIGPETDDDLFERVRTTIVDLGGSIADSEWVLGGSQEVTTYKIVLPAGTLEAVVESYIGLSLVGDEALVYLLAQRVMLNLPLDTDAPAGRRVAPH